MEAIKTISDFFNIILLPLLGLFMFYNSKKRKVSAEADKMEAEVDKLEADNTSKYASEWKELYEKKETKVIELEGTVSRLYSEKNEDRLRIRESMEEITRLKLENQRLAFLKCDIALKCFDRIPPNEFTREENNQENKDHDNK